MPLLARCWFVRTMPEQSRTIFAEMNLLENAAVATPAAATTHHPLKVPAIYHHHQPPPPSAGMPAAPREADRESGSDGSGQEGAAVPLLPHSAFRRQLQTFTDLNRSKTRPNFTTNDDKNRINKHERSPNGKYISQNEALYEKLKLNAEKFGMHYTLQTSPVSSEGWCDVGGSAYNVDSRHPILLSGVFTLNDDVEPLNYVKHDRVIAEMIESNRVKNCIKPVDDKELEGGLEEEEGAEERKFTELINDPEVRHESGNLSDRRTPESDDDDDACMTSPDSPRRSLHNNSAEHKKLYNCQHCKYVTDRKNNLKRHVVTMHENCGRVLECCDHVFKNKAALRDHVSQCHKNGYDCRICGRNFCRKALLKRHVTVHSGQKDYICSICGYATSHKSNLDRHKRRHESKYQIDENLPQLRSTAHTFDILRFLPTAFTCTPPPEPSTPFYLPFNTDDTSDMRPYVSHRHKQHRNGRYIFTKRLQYTHPENEAGDSTLTLDTSSEEIDVERVEVDEEPEMGDDDDALMSSAGSDVTSMTQSSRRLAPAIYRCKDCDVVFSKQLELARHQEAKHLPVEYPSMPHRPLTLQARTSYPD